MSLFLSNFNGLVLRQLICNTGTILVTVVIAYNWWPAVLLNCRISLMHFFHLFLRERWIEGWEGWSGGRCFCNQSFFLLKLFLNGGWSRTDTEIFLNLTITSWFWRESTAARKDFRSSFSGTSGTFRYLNAIDQFLKHFEFYLRLSLLLLLDGGVAQT